MEFDVFYLMLYFIWVHILVHKWYTNDEIAHVTNKEKQRAYNLQRTVNKAFTKDNSTLRSGRNMMDFEFCYAHHFLPLIFFYYEFL